MGTILNRSPKGQGHILNIYVPCPLPLSDKEMSPFVPEMSLSCPLNIKDGI